MRKTRAAATCRTSIPLCDTGAAKWSIRRRDSGIKRRRRISRTITSRSITSRSRARFASAASSSVSKAPQLKISQGVGTLKHYESRSNERVWIGLPPFPRRAAVGVLGDERQEETGFDKNGHYRSRSVLRKAAVSRSTFTGRSFIYFA